MNEAIKNRIDQVRYGEVPDGYKVTQSGILPMSWHAEQLSQHLQEYTEFSNDVVSLPVATSSREGLLLQSEYYQQQRFDEIRIGYHVVPQDYITYRHMSDDDIFHFNINTFGQKVLVSPEYPVFTVKPTLILTLFVDYINSSDRFLYYCRAQKKGSTRTRLYFKNLLKFQMPIPPLPEQQKIAEILTCCDQVISLKKQLLEEKRRQKKWLMQKLLDPDSGVRLPGFENSVWEKRTLISCGKWTGGGTPSKQNKAFWENGTIKWISSQDVKSRRTEKTTYSITCAAVAASATNTVPQGSIIIVARSGILKRRFPVSYIEETMAINQDIKALIPGKDIYGLFILSWIEANESKLLKDYVKTGTTVQSIMFDQFLGIEIMIPSLEEQRAINSVLECFYREIDLLEQELSQWQQKKKALMQLLLTGIVCVNV